SPESSQKEVEYETPEIIDLTIREDATFESVDGCFVETKSDFPELGYPDWDGEMLQAGDDSALAETMEQINEDLLFRQIQEHKNLMETAPYSDDEEIYFRSDTFVTRNDSVAVSFYHHIDYYDGYGGQGWTAVNIDTKTGRELPLQEVFTDTEQLSAVLTEKLRETYPYLAEEDSLADLIDDMVKEEMGINFALSYGFVHFFFQEYTLPVSIDGHHIILSMEEYPELVKEEYQVFPESYMLELEYGTEVLTENGNRLLMSWDMDEEGGETIIWKMAVNGGAYTEEFYGYAPQSCYLIHKNSRDYLYLHEPMGDISKATNVYEVRSNVKKLGRADVGMYPLVNLNPDRMLMDLNDMLFADDILLIPSGRYYVGRNGMPVLLENTFGVTGTDMVGKETFRIYMTDPKDDSVEEGFTTVAQGIILTPFRTDMETYLDLFTEDGRAIRLTIDGWDDEMQIHGFGSLNDSFESYMDYY
ncbi:MAG: hypothetical protein IJE27_01505, partial [Anaerotignum sp.]|nr:hypothetical protein [Anaerotignum sp.]